MAPRRGGGSSSGYSSGGSSSSSYNPDAIFQRSEMYAMYAEIAAAGVLLAAAIIAILMLMNKSWVRRDGGRNKLRLFTFLGCLFSIIVSRAIFVAYLVVQVQGSNDIADLQALDWYNSWGFTVRSIIISIFRRLSVVLFFGLIIVEATRHNAEVLHKRSGFEKFSFFTLLLILLLSLTDWLLPTIVMIQIKSGTYNAYFWSYDLGLGLALALNIMCFLFAVMMMLHTPASKVHTEPLSKARYSALRFTLKSLSVSQALYLTAICLFYFGSSSNSTPYLSVLAADDVIWAVNILGMAALARHSCLIHRAGFVYDHPTTYQQGHDQNQLSQKDSFYSTTTGISEPYYSSTMPAIESTYTANTSYKQSPYPPYAAIGSAGRPYHQYH